MLRQRPDADLIVQGWVVGVMVEVAGERYPVRHYFGVGKAEREQAEWAAVDRALEVGGVASSPFRGVEPVEAIREIVAYRMRDLGLKPGEIRALGDKFPRRWLPVDVPPP
jgi:hypothetical protein